jgi:hypothetical protein
MKYGTFFTSEQAKPKGEHWAILELRFINIPGDERSRQAPGHGYPEHTETSVSYEYFTDEVTFKAELTRRMQSPFNRDRLVGIHVAETFGPVVLVEPQRT